MNDLMNDTIHINISRVTKNLTELAKFGGTPAAGVNRALGDESYVSSYEWLRSRWAEQLRLPVTTDAIANLWVSRPGSEALGSIVLGSHHDAVRNGGRYDGALGVLLAAEVFETLNEHGIKTRHPLKLVSFTAEEPNPFNLSTLGSKVISGRLSATDLLPVTSPEGDRLADAIAGLGGDLPACDAVRAKPGDIAAFVECHVEQSKNLDERGLSLASVTRITGIYRETIRITGEANHSGTTRLRDRRDALLAAAEFLCAFERLIGDFHRDDLAGTVGRLTVEPNSANIIPCQVTLLLEIRSCDAELRRAAVEAAGRALADICAKRGVAFVREVILNQAEQRMDETVRGFLNRGIAAIGEPVTELDSMAGHDAANLQLFTRAGMLFVRSIDGKSHCFDEYSEPDDIEKAGNALLNAILLMDKELN